MENILQYVFWGNTVLEYFIFVGLAVFGLIVIKVFSILVVKRLEDWARRTSTRLDDVLIEMVRTIAVPFAYFGVLYLSISNLVEDPTVKRAVDITMIAILTFFTARLAISAITHGLKIYWTKRGEDVALERSLKGLLNVAKLLIWGLAITFFLDNLGFKISAVIAGLGIGGVAIALAAQAILGDLFSYFSILFDRPFEVGDFIIVGEYLGTIEHIGIKTTRIRSLGGEQLIFSNTDLTNSRLRNYKRMEKRRVVFKIGVTYQTPLAKLEKIPGIIERIIKNARDTAFDRAHFSSYGDFSLIFEVVYYVLSANYNKYMDTQQEINLAIKKEFEKEGIEFAYPTQTLYIDKTSK